MSGCPSLRAPVTVVVPPQLSTAVGATMLTVAVQPVVLLVVVLIDVGQVSDGASLSLTVTVKLQLGPAEVLQLTVVVPTGKKSPELCEQVTVPQPAVVVGAAKLTFAPH